MSVYGKILLGGKDVLERSYARFNELPVDQDVTAGEADDFGGQRTTIGKTVTVTGPGTFFGKAYRMLVFEPTQEKGWWFKREDIPEAMPIHVTVNNVWTTVRNIVLCSGSPHNYMRMVEHIVALRVGMGLDNLMIKMVSGDPPLFDRGSMDLVETIESAGIVPLKMPAEYFTVPEPVSVVTKSGGFLTFLPAENGRKDLIVDCGIDFPSAIGKQRIRFVNNRKSFRHGALARTNTTLLMMMYCKTIGMLFADTRNLGYTMKNILVAGPKKYVNEPNLLHNGKSLEAAWHRATLDLLAAVALIDRGRFAGTIISYKAGHALDVQMVRELYQRDLLKPL